MSRCLHGLHASSWRDGITLPQTKYPGWFVFTEIAGSEGGDYRRWADAGYGIIVRLNNGYHPNGTIPAPEGYDAFATRCAAFVSNSKGCSIWIISNETNHSQERPNGMPIQPEHYAACFLKCYAAIKQRHPADLVLPAPIAPYNWETGDCLIYLSKVAGILVAKGAVDGWVLHAYTRAHDPTLIYQEQIVNGWQWHYRTYRDQLAVLGKHKLDVPVFLTEYNPTDGWANENRGYIHEALCEIDAWNQANPRQIIRAVCAYRWHDPSRKEWSIRDKAGVVADYCRAADVGYSCDSWDSDDDEEEPMPESEWLQVYLNACERGFYDQDGVPELTIPVGTQVFWLEDPSAEGKLDRPEMDLKDVMRHPEVYEGRFSGSGMFQSTTGRLFLVTDPIYVQNGRPVRGTCKYLQELRKIQGGGRLGIVDGDGLFVGKHERPPSDEEIFAAGAVWGDWYNWQQPEKVWTDLATPQIVPTKGHVRLVLRFNLDYAKWGGFCYDLLKVEQYLEGVDPVPPVPPPPQPGDVLRVEVTGPGGGPMLVRMVE